MKTFCFTKKSTIYVLLVVLSFFSLNLSAQNIAITDDNLHVADPSAMLDIKSTTKGLLIPRLLTEQRVAVANPAKGLLVFDIDESAFFYFDGSDWVNLSNSELWTVNSNFVLLSDSTARVGIGTFTPNSKLEVKADASFTSSDTLFAVKDKDGNIVFAVFPDGAKVYINEFSKGSVGGFAVSGRSPTKATEEDFMKITPDSSRIWIREDTAKGRVGGFAVSGRSPTKSEVNDYFISTADSTRIYVIDTVSGKGRVGGFAVSGRSPTKGPSTGSFLNLTPDNYFIGRNSGVNNTIGRYNFFAGDSSGYSNTSGSKNIFLGYASGHKNIGEGLDFGNYNIFIGYKAGYKNQIGYKNIFLGYQAGYNNLGGGGFEEGSFNTFIGYESGFNSTTAGSNTFLGYQSGYENKDGAHNTFIGRWAGKDNVDGSYNVFIGTEAGRQEMGSYKLCINAINFPGYSPPLIYGEFDNRNVVIDGDAGNNPGIKFFVNGSAGGPEDWITTGKKIDFKSKTYISNALDKVLLLNGINYTNTDAKGKIIEHIAIDPEAALKIIPEIVMDYGEDYGIEYSKLSILLIEAIKEQQQQINELQKIVETKDAELQKMITGSEQIDLLIEENKKIKQDIDEIKDLIQLNSKKE